MNISQYYAIRFRPGPRSGVNRIEIYHMVVSYYQSEVFFLHGGTSKKNRQIMIDRFQEDPRGPTLFLLSLNIFQ